MTSTTPPDISLSGATAEGEGPPLSLLGEGDALRVCAALPPTLRLDLVYLDPPYGLGTTMAARTRSGESRGRRKATAGPDAYVDPAGPEELLELLLPRLMALRERMAPGATLWLHLDHRAVHEVKVAVDRLFGREAFLGEVIWSMGNGSRGAKTFGMTHQTLLRWVRAPAEKGQAVWNADDPDLREPYAPTSLSMHFRQVDSEGRRYRERTVGGKTYRYFADQGRRLGSVWTDIPAMVANTPLRAEGTGYPTQKPERLLERIVRASSQPGAVVADLMCGSGTTLIAASKLGRTFVGGDASPLALRITRERLSHAGVRYQELGEV